jgi:hypothetical protein
VQVRAREEELLNLTSLHTATKASADKRITALEARVAKLLEANRCAWTGGKEGHVFSNSTQLHACACRSVVGGVVHKSGG